MLACAIVRMQINSGQNDFRNISFYCLPMLHFCCSSLQRNPTSGKITITSCAQPNWLAIPASQLFWLVEGKANDRPPDLTEIPNTNPRDGESSISTKRQAIPFLLLLLISSHPSQPYSAQSSIPASSPTVPHRSSAS